MPPPTRIDDIIDTYLLPARNALRRPDVTFSGPTGVITPGSMTAIAYFEAKHTFEARHSWTKFAIPIEWITTVGSILLLVIALIRVFNS